MRAGASEIAVIRKAHPILASAREKSGGNMRIERWIRSALAALIATAWPGWGFAQQSSSNDAVTTTTSTVVWYGHWWVWAVAVAVFLVVVIALTSRGGRSSA
jgi:hypothetical protein